MILFHLLDSSFLSTEDTTNLLTTYPALEELYAVVIHLANYVFLWINDHNPSWATWTNIDTNKPTAFLAYLFQFRMDICLVMRCLGSNYTAAHHNVEDVITWISPCIDSTSFHF